MVNLKINNRSVKVPDGYTIIQACDDIGVEIPRFCYHKNLRISGNCRMCLVEIVKAPKLVPSCAQVVSEGMEVLTHSAKVQEARKGVMEFLLINHPLDCPICDQGGECDLQDQAVIYGKGSSGYKESKRAVLDKDFGPLIKTHMTRCIHCSRCERFLEDVAGTNDLGMVGRGENSEIVSFIKEGMSSELSGNIIDLCPVGALTSKPYEFKARNWELTTTKTIDIMDAVGSNILISSKGNEVLRVLPDVNPNINEEWISDKTRFFYDSLKYQRLDVPYVKKNNIMSKVSWEEALTYISDQIKKTPSSKIGAIAGNLTDVETMMVMKDYLDKLGSGHYDCRQNGSMLPAAHRSQYIFNTTINGIEEADHCLIIGCNPRYEASIVNARIRKSYLYNNLDVTLIGPKVDLTYPYKHLGNNPWIVKQIVDGEHPICDTLAKYHSPMLILGERISSSYDFENLYYYVQLLAKKYGFVTPERNNYNILHTSASRVGGLDINFTPAEGFYNTHQILKYCDIIILMGADEVDFSQINQDALVIYIGHHGDKAAGIADVVLPAPSFVEKDGTFVNLEGRPQRAHKAVDPLGEARVDWKIILDLAKLTGIELGYNAIDEIRDKMCERNHVFKKISTISPSVFEEKKLKKAFFEKDRFPETREDYYLTNSMCRNSVIMNKCSTSFQKHF